MLDCAVAKRKAKRNARRGTVNLRGDDEREVKTYQEDVAKLKAERRRKEEDAQPKPMVRTVHDCPEAISRLARPEPRPGPRIYSEPQPTFQAKPLPKTYGAPAARSGTIVERSQAWLAEKRALRDAERERRRKEKEAEVTAKPRLADPEAWAKAKDEVSTRRRRCLPSRWRGETRREPPIDAGARFETRAMPRLHHRSHRENARDAHHTGAGGARQGGTGRARTRTDEGTARSQERSAPPAEGRRDRGHARGAESPGSTARGEAGQAERRTQGHGPHEGVAPGRAQTRYGAGTGVDRGRRGGRKAGDGRGPVPRPRALPPQLRRAAHFRWRAGLVGRRGVDRVRGARAAADRLDETLAASPQREEDDVGFFDPTSSEERGRKRVRDARLFEPSSMRRAVAEDGVVLLLGELAEHPRTEHVICVLFDRSKFSERAALQWWREGGGRWRAGFRRPLTPSVGRNGPAVLARWRGERATAAAWALRRRARRRRNRCWWATRSRRRRARRAAPGI